MEPQIEEIEIKSKLQEWDLTLPKGLAFFPENIDQATKKEDFVFAEPLTQLRKIYKANDVAIEVFGNPPLKLRAKKSADLYLPTLFVGASLMSQNQAAISVALSVLANYITDFFKGTVGKKTVTLEILVEKTDKKTIKRIKYSGEVEGLKNLDHIIKQLN